MLCPITPGEYVGTKQSIGDFNPTQATPNEQVPLAEGRNEDGDDEDDNIVEIGLEDVENVDDGPYPSKLDDDAGRADIQLEDLVQVDGNGELNLEPAPSHWIDRPVEPNKQPQQRYHKASAIRILFSSEYHLHSSDQLCRVRGFTKEMYHRPSAGYGPANGEGCFRPGDVALVLARVDEVVTYLLISVTAFLGQFLDHNEITLEEFESTPSLRLHGQILRTRNTGQQLIWTREYENISSNPSKSKAATQKSQSFEFSAQYAQPVTPQVVKETISVQSILSNGEEPSHIPTWAFSTGELSALFLAMVESSKEDNKVPVNKILTISFASNHSCRTIPYTFSGE